jgi:hypothetical protein
MAIGSDTQGVVRSRESSAGESGERRDALQTGEAAVALRAEPLSANQRADLLSEHDPANVAALIQVEHDDRQVIVFA